MAGISPSTPVTAETLLEILRSAVAEHRLGRGAEASARYRQVLALEPSVADAWHLLGLLASDAGRAGIATLLVGRAITLDERAVLYRFNLGNVLNSAGRIEDAAVALERVIDRQPDHEPSVRNLGGILARLAFNPEAVRRSRRRWGTSDDATFHAKDEYRRAHSGPGYLLIRGWGCGFWGEVAHAAIQLALADIMGRAPLVYWGSEFHYRCPGFENAWDAYFEPVSETSQATLSSGTQDYFPKHWTAANLWTSRVKPMQQSPPLNPYGLIALPGLNRTESIVVADGYVEMSDVLPWAAPRHPLFGSSADKAFRMMLQQRIRLKPAIQVRIDALARGIVTGSPVMAVHFRAQNDHKSGESLERAAVHPENYFADIDLFLRSNPDGRVLLITDVETAVDEFRMRLGGRLIVLPRQRVAHGSQFDIGLDHSRNLYSLALEVIEDVYLAARCDAFLGDGASGVSCTIAALKDWPEGRIKLLRRNVFLERRAGRP
ncbi:MAG: hypothetical protein FJX54_10290 [Alphaproteobacteria bacterium]|nr:hypothetical protein [Alphaproteobacteria bacterium]